MACNGELEGVENAKNKYKNFNYYDESFEQACIDSYIHTGVHAYIQNSIQI